MKDPTITAGQPEMKDALIELARSYVRKSLATNYLDAVRLMAKTASTGAIHDVEVKWAQWWLSNWEDDSIPKYKA